MSEVRIEAHALTKRYGNLTAVRDLNFSIESGEVLGFLGPNGAGKSTTMKMLTGFLAPTSGTASINGHDIISDSLAGQRLLRAANGRSPRLLPWNASTCSGCQSSRSKHYPRGSGAGWGWPRPFF